MTRDANPFGARFSSGDPFRPVNIRAVYDDEDSSTVIVVWDGRGTTTAGTTYHNTSKFMGRETELTYEVVQHQPDSVFALRGENSSVVAHDTMEIEPHGTGSRVTYTADFAFSGVARVVAPLLAPALKKLGDEAGEGLQQALAKL